MQNGLPIPSLHLTFASRLRRLALAGEFNTLEGYAELLRAPPSSCAQRSWAVFRISLAESEGSRGCQQGAKSLACISSMISI